MSKAKAPETTSCEDCIEELKTQVHEPHCPVPRMAAQGEGAVCLCVKPRTLKELAQEALDMQDACNMVALVASFAAAVKELPEAAGIHSSDAIAQHPVTRLWTSKLLDLSRMGLADQDTWCDAYNACRQLAGQI